MNSILLASNEFLIRFLFAHRHIELAYFPEQAFWGFLDLHLWDKILPVVELSSESVVAFKSVEPFENAREVLQVQETFCIFSQKGKNFDSTLDEQVLPEKEEHLLVVNHGFAWVIRLAGGWLL